jgi:hypothetical protein
LRRSDDFGLHDGVAFRPHEPARLGDECRSVDVRAGRLPNGIRDVSVLLL